MNVNIYPLEHNFIRNISLYGLLIVIDDKDDDFELTAEMLIHGNVDDEGTLEEEEILEELEDEGSSGELTDLQKVNCMYSTTC